MGGDSHALFLSSVGRDPKTVQSDCSITGSASAEKKKEGGASRGPSQKIHHLCWSCFVYGCAVKRRQIFYEVRSCTISHFKVGNIYSLTKSMISRSQLLRTHRLLKLEGEIV
jgi:hypothetical protein